MDPGSHAGHGTDAVSCAEVAEVRPAREVYGRDQRSEVLHIGCVHIDEPSDGGFVDVPFRPRCIDRSTEIVGLVLLQIEEVVRDLQLTGWVRGASLVLE